MLYDVTVSDPENTWLRTDTVTGSRFHACDRAQRLSRTRQAIIRVTDQHGDTYDFMGTGERWKR